MSAGRKDVFHARNVYRRIVQNRLDNTFLDTTPSVVLSVVITTLNDAAQIRKTLDAVSRLVNVDEVIVVDGGSTDETIEIAETHEKLKKIKLVKMKEPNRARRLNEGAANAGGEALWFLRADTQPVQGSGRQIKQFMRYRQVVGGNFEIAFAEDTRLTRFLKRIYPYLRQVGFVYIDSAIFVRGEVFREMNGFRPLPDFEDLDFYRRLQKRGRFVHVNLPVAVSTRRFENAARMKTFSGWSFFQTLYWLGVPVRLMAKFYKSEKQ